MRTIRVLAAAQIDAPADRVYEIIADYHDGHPHILPRKFFTGLEVEKGGVGAGTIIRADSKLFGRTQSIRLEVSEPQPGCVLVERDPVGGIVTTFRVSPEHRGHHAHVTIVTDFPRSRGIKGLIESWMLPRIFEKVYIEELRLLGSYARRMPVARAA